MRAIVQWRTGNNFRATARIRVVAPVVLELGDKRIAAVTRPAVGEGRINQLALVLDDVGVVGDFDLAEVAQALDRPGRVPSTA
mgnify:CR=1 FL=1